MKKPVLFEMILSTYKRDSEVLKIFQNIYDEAIKTNNFDSVNIPKDLHSKEAVDLAYDTSLFVDKNMIQALFYGVMTHSKSYEFGLVPALFEPCKYKKIEFFDPNNQKEIEQKIIESL